MRFRLRLGTLCRSTFSAVISLSILFIFGCSSNKPDAKPVLKVWHWMTDRGPAFQELAKRYEALTGIKVKFELYATSDAYTQKVRATAQGINLPDIFGVLGEKKDFASFIRAGHILDLTSYMDASEGAWRDEFFPKALAVNEFRPGNGYSVDPGVYGVPLDIMTIQMVYNKDILDLLGVRPPSTFKELLDIGKKLKAANIQGLVSGWGEIWMIDCFASNYAFNIMGQDKVLATIRGEVPYTDPDWIKVLGLFKEMQDSRILANGLVTMVNKIAEQLFANGRAAFAFNGSWCVNVYRGMSPGLNYGAMLPPKASEQYPMAIWGGAGSSLVVNARSRNKEEAVKFLKWLTGADQQAYLSGMTNNLPANKNSIVKAPEVLAQFARGMEQATHPSVWGVSEFSPVIEAFDKGIQSIIIGEKTPEAVAAEVQRIKERELAKRKI